MRPSLTAFFANLTLSGSPLACDYLGHLPADKEFGSLRMYQLREPASFSVY